MDSGVAFDSTLAFSDKAREGKVTHPSGRMIRPGPPAMNSVCSNRTPAMLLPHG